MATADEKFVSDICGYVKEYNSDIKNLLEKARGEEPESTEAMKYLFAAVYIAAEKGLGQTPFPEQLLAARALTEGKIIEMPTGEGKTMAAVFAAAWHNMQGRRVHILTFNDYLASRDRGWMKPIYDLLGTDTALITEKSDFEARKAGYSSSVLYISARECCFDYLRDFTAQSPKETTGQTFEAAIVDEADSLLIDEARIPMVVAGDTEIKSDEQLEAVSQFVSGFTEEDYEISLETENVFLTDEGAAKTEEHFDIDNIYDESNTELLSKIYDCLKARFFLKEDSDYICREGKILLIDKFTGRVAENRNYPGGLQSAVELKHGLKVTARGVVMGSVALQYFIRKYSLLSAMTGTAEDSKEEFYQIYDLSFEKIPPHLPNRRTDREMSIYFDSGSKWRAIADTITSAHEKNQPILIGTESISDSEQLYEMLKERGIEATVLNAKNDSAEAEIIGNAGDIGAVTISTNMAGRGVDIRLGGKDEKNRDEALKAGGLLVISTYMPESGRIVKQLLGRSGRQGDPGESRRFVALDEPIMDKYKLNSLLPPKHIPKAAKEAIEDKVLLREVERIQRISEGDSFDVRERLMKFTMIGEKHRDQIFETKERILKGSGLKLWSGCERYSEAVEKLGEEKVISLEQKTALAAVNRFWSGYLEYTEEIRRGIHLVEVGGKSPAEEYNIAAEEYYRDMEENFKDYMEERLELLLDGGEENYTIDTPKNIHTYLLNDTGSELNKMPFLFNVFSDEDDMRLKEGKTEAAAFSEEAAPSVLEAPIAPEKSKEKKKGFFFRKKKQ